MGCDFAFVPQPPQLKISIHAARMGCDDNMLMKTARQMIFQSTQPEWAATDARRKFTEQERISIHAARMGCDGP